MDSFVEKRKKTHVFSRVGVLMFKYVFNDVQSSGSTMDFEMALEMTLVCWYTEKVNS